MTNQIKNLIFTLCLLGALQACTEEGTSHDKSQVNSSQLTPAFTIPTVQVKSANGETIKFGIKNCRVYRSVQTQSTKPDWKLFFQPAPYPIPKMCIIERLEFDGNYVQIEIGTQAIGAGGCCTTYAAYRTLDGKAWEMRPATSIKDWQNLELKE